MQKFMRDSSESSKVQNSNENVGSKGQAQEVSDGNVNFVEH